jgi:hypothetical protein
MAYGPTGLRNPGTQATRQEPPLDLVSSKPSGHLNAKYGLSCDNMVEAQVVGADGTVRTASADTESDLWCSRPAWSSGAAPVSWSPAGAGSKLGPFSRLSGSLPGGRLRRSDAPVVAVDQGVMQPLVVLPEPAAAVLRKRSP